MARYHSPSNVQCLKMLASYFYEFSRAVAEVLSFIPTFLLKDTARQCLKGKHLVTGEFPGFFKGYFELQSYHMGTMSLYLLLSCHLCSKAAQLVP